MCCNEDKLSRQFRTQLTSWLGRTDERFWGPAESSDASATNVNINKRAAVNFPFRVFI